MRRGTFADSHKRLINPNDGDEIFAQAAFDEANENPNNAENDDVQPSDNEDGSNEDRIYLSQCRKRTKSS